MDADLDTLATALYVRTDDLLKMAPQRRPWRPPVGIFTSEARWLRFTADHLGQMFGPPGNSQAAVTGCDGLPAERASGHDDKDRP